MGQNISMHVLGKAEVANREAITHFPLAEGDMTDCTS